MTGQYPDRVGVPGVIRTHDDSNWGYFSQESVTLPEMLERSGYRTHLIGKWHLGLEPENHPCRRGFGHFRGFLGDMMDDYYTHLRHGLNYMRHGLKEIHPEGHATDIFTQWAIEVLEDQARSNDPFFLYLAYNAPHTPIQPPDEWVERVSEREPEASQERIRYSALVEHMDAGIGRVLDALENLELADDTLAFYTSDNGGWLPGGADNGDLRGQKGDVYEGGIRVPACAMWPEHISPGTVTDEIALLMDLFPTACQLGGSEIVHEIEGRSILPTLLGEDQDLSSRTLYWVRREGTPRFLGLCQHAVRLGDLKLLHNRPFEPLELFDMALDPAEETNLSNDRDRLEGMAKIMREEIQRAGHVPWQKG
jgi:arylsulfatase A-like enzyme